MSAPTYYRASNRVSPRLWLALLVIGGGGALVLGLIYAFACCLITQVFEESALYIFVTPFFGAGLAFVGQRVANLGKVRRQRLRLPIALLVGVFGLYASWHAYLVLVDLRGVFNPTPTWTMSPITVARAVAQLGASESWLAWFGWLVEAAVVFGMIAYLMRSVDLEIPFCEACGEWTSEVFHLELAASDTANAADKLRHGDAAALAQMSRRESGASEYAVLRVYRCTCGDSRYVSLDRATVKLGKPGGLRYSPRSLGGRPKVHYDMGRGDTTDLAPVIVNLAIDEAAEKALDAARGQRRASSAA